MRALSTILSILLLIAIILASAIFIYYAVNQFIFSYQPRENVSFSQPLHILAISYNAETNFLTLVLLNPNDAPIDLSNTKIYLRSGGMTYADLNFNTDCNYTISPHSTCTLTATTPQLRPDSYVLISSAVVPPTTAPLKTSSHAEQGTIDTVPPSVTLTLSSQSAFLGDAISITCVATDNVSVSLIKIYLGNTELNTCSSSPCVATYTFTSPGVYTFKCTTKDSSGNTSTVEKNISVINPFSVSHGLTFSSPDENRYSNILFHGDYNKVYITIFSGKLGTYSVISPCLQETTLTCSSFPCTIETNTLSASSSCEINIVGPDNDVKSITIPVWHYLECDSCDSCEDALTEADTLSNNDDVNVLVVLKADISSSSSICLNIDGVEPPAGTSIIFDANLHTVSTSGNDTFAVALSWSSLIFSHCNIFTSGDGSHAFYLFYSSATLRECNLFTSGVDARPLYAFYDSSANLYDSNLSTSGWRSDAVYIYYSSSANLTRCNLFTSNEDAIPLHLNKSSSATITDCNIFTLGRYSPAVFVNNSSTATVSDSVLTALGYRGDALFLQSYSSAIVKDSNLFALGDDSHALNLYQSYITLSNVNLDINREKASDYILAFDSYVSSSENSYCGDGKRIIAISSSNANDYNNVVIDTNAYCHISVHDVNNLKLNFAGTATDIRAAYLILYRVNNVEINGLRVNTTGYLTDTLSVHDSSSVVISNSVLSATGSGSTTLLIYDSTATFDLSEGDIRICTPHLNLLSFSNSTVECQNCGNGHNLIWYDEYDSSLPFACSCAVKASSFDECVGS